MTEFINGQQYADMIVCAAAALSKNRRTIDELNVFPVPDGDTGTNMTLTVTTASRELVKKSWERADEAADKAAGMMLRGARGNSGVILSLLFRGMAKELKGSATATALDMASAMSAGVDAAYKAVMKPAEGTILTVSRRAAEAALDAATTEPGVEAMLSSAIATAQEALAETVEQNPVLKRAGVVDAGGKGYVYILQSWLDYLEGRVKPEATGEITQPEEEGADFSEFDTEEITFAYDTVYIVRKNENTDLAKYRAYLDKIGDSIVISEDDEIFKVHVHTNIPGDALTEAQKHGVIEVAKIENMRTQHEEKAAGKKTTTADDLNDDPIENENYVAEPEKEFGFVAVCAGKGLEALFRDLGADNVVTGGQTMNPSTEDILKAVNRTPAKTVYVFPNNKNIIMAAEQAIPLSEKKVIVIPTRTVPQGITAMVNYDPEASEDVITETFRSVIDGVHTAQVTYAARDSVFDGYDIKAGEYLGLLDGALLGSFSEAAGFTGKLCESFAKIDPEFITVYYGEDVSEEEANGLGAALEGKFPNAEVTVISGGQPVYYYMISAE